MNRSLANRALMSLFLATALVACASWKPIVEDMLSAGDIACIVAHAGADDATVRKICGLTDALMIAMKRILAEERQSPSRACSAEVALCTID